MQYEIIKYPVRNPLLQNYIKFFWEIHIDYMHLSHKLIPQRNINMRFNLSGTPQYVCVGNEEYLLEDVFFSGLQDRFMNASMKLAGKVDMIGISFLPDGFYPFLKIPVSELKNRLSGAGEAGLKQADIICEQLREAPDVITRLDILEDNLVALLDHRKYVPENLRRVFSMLNRTDHSFLISEFCQRNKIGMRQLERIYNKYVGVSALTYGTLNRFHKSLNQLLRKDYMKLSDIAYGNGYFDQMHFIKDFKRFAGNTPKNFILQSNSMLQIGKLK